MQERKNEPEVKVSPEDAVSTVINNVDDFSTANRSRIAALSALANTDENKPDQARKVIGDNAAIFNNANPNQIDDAAINQLITHSRTKLRSLLGSNFLTAYQNLPLKKQRELIAAIRTQEERSQKFNELFSIDIAQKDIIINDTQYKTLIAAALVEITPRLVEQIQTKITNLNIDDADQAATLAAFTECKNEDDVNNAVIAKKPQLELNDIPNSALKSSIFKNATGTAPHENARATLQRQIYAKIIAKINTFQIPKDQGVLDALENADTRDKLTTAIVTHRNKLDIPLQIPNGILETNFYSTDAEKNTIFNNAVTHKRLAASPDGQVVLSAITKLQATIPANAQTAAYKNLNNTLWSNPDARTVLLALANALPGNVDSKTTTLTDALRPLIAITNPQPTQAEIKQRIDEIQLTAGAAAIDNTVNLAQAIHAANESENQTRAQLENSQNLARAQIEEITRLKTELEAKVTEIEATRATVEKLHTEAQAAVARLAPPPAVAGAAAPAASPFYADREAKRAELNNTLTTLATLKANTIAAAANIQTELDHIAAGTHTHAEALNTAQAIHNSQVTAITAATPETLATAATAAYKGVMAEPQFSQTLPLIPAAIYINAREADAKENDKRELALCERAKTAYEYSIKLKNAAEAGDTRAFELLTETKTRISEIKSTIDNKIRDRGYVQNDLTKMTQSITTWLGDASTQLTALQSEITYLETQRDVLKNRVRVINTNANRVFTDDELKSMNKTETQLNEWRNTVVSGRVLPAARPAFEMRRDDALIKTQHTEAKKELLENYRVNIPSGARRNDPLYYVHEKRTAPNTAPIEHRLVGLDLPETVSHRGALIKLLTDRKAIDRSTNNVMTEADIRTMVYASSRLSPVFTLEELTAFLKHEAKITSAASSLPGVQNSEGAAKQFMNETLVNYQTQKVMIYDSYINKDATPPSTINQAAYLALSLDKREEYKGVSSYMHKNQKSVIIPEEDIFKTAGVILSDLAASGNLPTSVKHMDPQTLIAVHCIAKLHGIDAHIEFPKDAKLSSEKEQIAANIRGYQNWFNNPAKVDRILREQKTDIETHEPAAARTLRP